MWWEFINFQLAKWLSCWSMRLEPHTVTDAIRLDIRTSSKWLPCQKALIPHKMHKELKKINSATLEMKINFTALNCFSCQKSHISIISCVVCREQLIFFAKVQGRWPQIAFKSSFLSYFVSWEFLCQSATHRCSLAECDCVTMRQNCHVIWHHTVRSLDIYPIDIKFRVCNSVISPLSPFEKFETPMKGGEGNCWWRYLM